MDFVKIKTFLLVAQRLSFSRAAEELFISQSAVSQHVKALEEEMGIALLQRNRTQVTLTREGEIMQKTFREMMERYALGMQAIEKPHSPCTTLVIGYPCTSHWMNMPELVRRFSEKHDVDIRMQIKESQKNLLALQSGLLDLVFTSTWQPFPKELTLKPLFVVPFNVALHPQNALCGQATLTPSQIYGERVFAAKGEPENAAIAKLNQAILSCGIDPARLFLVPHREEVLAAVASGQGVGLVPADLPYAEQGNLITVPFDAPDVFIPYGCVYRPGANPMVETFLQEFKIFLQEKG